MVTDISSIIAALSGWQYFEYAVAVGIVALTVLVARLVLYVFDRHLKEFAAQTETKLDDIIIGIMTGPVYIIVLLLGVYFALGYIQIPYMAQVETCFRVLMVLLGTWIVYNVVYALIREYGHLLAERTSTQIDDVIMPVLEKISGIFIVLVGLLIILDLLRINITPMLAGMGIAGIAVALAAQETLSNMLSGFTLMVDRPFTLGDRILLDSGELCEVRDVGLRSTRLYNVVEHTQVTIPNAILSNMKITNVSAPDVKLKLSIPIGVAYGSDLDKVKSILLEIAEEAPHVLDYPEPMAMFMEFADSSLNLRLIVWIDDVREKLSVTDYINTRIKERFEEEEIDIPFPIRTVYMEKE